MSLNVCCCCSQALGLQDSDDEAEAEEKAVEEVICCFNFITVNRASQFGDWPKIWRVGGAKRLGEGWGGSERYLTFTSC